MKQREKETEFIKTIEQHQNILHKICSVYCCSQDDKKDLYQEMTLQLWKAYPSFQGRSAFSTWMYRVALNTAITISRKNQVQLKPEDTQLRIVKEMETLPDLSEDIRILYQAINRLNKIERAIILLWLEEKSYDEISEITGLTIKNVGVKLVRIKKKLAILIEKLS